MQKIVYFLIVFLLVIFGTLSACNGSGDQNVIHASLNEEFIIPFNKTAFLESENLRITFEDVLGDNRCPKGVVCIQAGEAVCQIGIEDTGEGGSSKKVLILKAVGLVDGYSQEKWSQNNEEYTFNYMVEPYPEAGRQINKGDYKLVLKIYR